MRPALTATSATILRVPPEHSSNEPTITVRQDWGVPDVRRHRIGHHAPGRSVQHSADRIQRCPGLRRQPHGFLRVLADSLAFADPGRGPAPWSRLAFSRHIRAYSTGPFNPNQSENILIDEATQRRVRG
jgi:hypothetical protein